MRPWSRHQMEIFPHYWRSPVDSPHKGQERGVWYFFLCAPEQTAEKTVDLLVILCAIALIMTTL